MKAYVARFDEEEWMMLIHGETRAKAKYRFLRCEPSGWADNSYWNSIRLSRLPEWDDKPFRDVPEIRNLFSYGDYDENGDEIQSPFINDCDCPICKGER